MKESTSKSNQGVLLLLLQRGGALLLMTKGRAWIRLQCSNHFFFDFFLRLIFSLFFFSSHFLRGSLPTNLFLSSFFGVLQQITSKYNFENCNFWFKESRAISYIISRFQTLPFCSCFFLWSKNISHPYGKTFQMIR